MFTVEKELKFDTAHRLLNYEGKCHNVHWHTYRAIFSIKTEFLNHQGMVKDFNEFKLIKDWIDENRDHAYIYWNTDEIGEFLTEKGYRTFGMVENPTAENMARFLQGQFAYMGVFKVQVYETPTSLAIYEKDEE